MAMSQALVIWGFNVRKILSKILTTIEQGAYEYMLWDKVVLNLYKDSNIRIKRFDSIYEIDTVDELKDIESIPNY